MGFGRAHASPVWTKSSSRNGMLGPMLQPRHALAHHWTSQTPLRYCTWRLGKGIFLCTQDFRICFGIISNCRIVRIDKDVEIRPCSVSESSDVRAFGIITRRILCRPSLVFTLRAHFEYVLFCHYRELWKHFRPKQSWWGTSPPARYTRSTHTDEHRLGPSAKPVNGPAVTFCPPCRPGKTIAMLLYLCQTIFLNLEKSLVLFWFYGPGKK